MHYWKSYIEEWWFPDYIKLSSSSLSANNINRGVSCLLEDNCKYLHKVSSGIPMSGSYHLRGKTSAIREASHRGFSKYKKNY